LCSRPGYRAGVDANVYVDLARRALLRHRRTEFVVDVLEPTLATKLLFATDASRLPEVFLLATSWWRRRWPGALAAWSMTTFSTSPTLCGGPS
jgi:hypothetical protein